MSKIELKEKSNPLGSPPSGPMREDALLGLRTDSWRRYEEAGIPTPKHEEWKYTSLRAVAEANYTPAETIEVSDEELAASPAGELKGPRIVFVNGRFDPKLTDLSGLPAGAAVLPLSKAIRQGAAGLDRIGRIATLEGKLGSFNDERFVWLNNATFEDGAYVHFPKSVQAAAPIHLVFLTKGGAERIQIFPRVFIALEEGARAMVTESHIGLSGASFSGPITEITLGRGAALDHIRLQVESPESHHIGTLAAHQETESTLNSTTAAFGAQLSRLDTIVWVGGEHAETSLNGVYVGDGTQVMDNHTRIDHAVPNCHSFEVYKGILGGKAQGVFNGKIFVYKDAQKTDAKQTNQALLLSKTAGVNTKPQLEIFADDVKCTHGATVGQLREDAMFYLRSRGIPEMEARNILVYAFAAEVFEGIADEGIRVELERLLTAKLSGAQIS